MKYHNLSVARELNVKLYSLAFLASKLKCLERVLGRSSAVKSSVRVVPEKRLVLGASCARTNEEQNIEQKKQKCERENG
jgi:hypothetical protein